MATTTAPGYPRAPLVPRKTLQPQRCPGYPTANDPPHPARGSVPAEPCPPPALPAAAPSPAGRDGPGLTAAAVAVAVPVAAGAAGVLHDNPLPAQVLPVQLVHGIVGVAGVLELHEAVAERRRKARSGGGGGTVLRAPVHSTVPGARRDPRSIPRSIARFLVHAAAPDLFPGH